MTSKTIAIINPEGIHVRLAAEFSQLASRYTSSIRVKNLETGIEVNGKSIIMLLTATLRLGTAICITADGPDEELAVSALSELVEGGFVEK